MEGQAWGLRRLLSAKGWGNTWQLPCSLNPEGPSPSWLGSFTPWHHLNLTSSSTHAHRSYIGGGAPEGWRGAQVIEGNLCGRVGPGVGGSPHVWRGPGGLRGPAGQDPAWSLKRLLGTEWSQRSTKEPPKGIPGDPPPAGLALSASLLTLMPQRLTRAKSAPEVGGPGPGISGWRNIKSVFPSSPTLRVFPPPHWSGSKHAFSDAWTTAFHSFSHPSPVPGLLSLHFSPCSLLPRYILPGCSGVPPICLVVWGPPPEFGECPRCEEIGTPCLLSLPSWFYLQEVLNLSFNFGFCDWSVYSFYFFLIQSWELVTF